MKMADVDFRVWDREQRRYIDGCFDDGCFKGIEIHEYGALAYIRNCDEEPSSISFFYNCNIEFFTGIKDGSGNKIYDGDIIAHCNHHGETEYHSSVRYVPNLAAFFSESIEHPINKPLCEVDLYSVKVVGNIHSREIPNINISSIQ